MGWSTAKGEDDVLPLLNITCSCKRYLPLVRVLLQDKQSLLAAIASLLLTLGEVKRKRLSRKRQVLRLSSTSYAILF